MKLKQKYLYLLFSLFICLNIFINFNVSVYGYEDSEFSSYLINTSDVGFANGKYLQKSGTTVASGVSEEDFLNSIRTMYKNLFISMQGTMESPFAENTYSYFPTIVMGDTTVDIETGVPYNEEGVLKIKMSEQDSERTCTLYDTTHLAYPAGEDDPVECSFLNEHCIAGEGRSVHSDFNRKKAELGDNARKMLTRILVAIKEGTIAGSVECSYNVLSAYSNSQLPLNDVMKLSSKKTAPSAKSTDKETEKEKNNTDSNEIYYEFKDTTKLKLSVDYCVNPLFGKLDLGSNLFDGIQFEKNGISITQAEAQTLKTEWWNKQVGNVQLSGAGTFVINEYFKNFVTNTDDIRAGLDEITTALPTEDIAVVSEYKYKTTTTKKPGQFMNYNMKVIVPSVYSRWYNSAYKLNENASSDAFKIIKDLRLCVRNDTFYLTTDIGQEIACTAKDLDLQRDYIMFYRYKENGIKMGAVVILKYDEGIIDTSGTEGGQPMIYKTGRKIVFDNGYSDSIKLNVANENLLGVYTSLQSKKGITLQNFAFPLKMKNNSTETLLTCNNDIESICEYYRDFEKHISVSDNAEDFQIVIGFNSKNLVYSKSSGLEISEDDLDEDVMDDSNQQDMDLDSDGKQDKKNIVKGFYILWNNSYVENSDLLQWLDTKEAQGLSNVYAAELKKLIKGEFDKSTMTYEDWLKVKEIKSQLEYDKNNIVYRVINVLGVIMGAVFIIFSVLILMVYWIDIFNTFTGKSILHTISLGHLYPIAEDTMSDYLKGVYGSDTHYVTFKNLLVISIFGCFIGFFLLNISWVVSILLKIYFTVVGLLQL